MVWAILFGVVMVFGIPIAVMLGGAVWSALFGWLESEDAADRAGCET